MLDAGSGMFRVQSLIESDEFSIVLSHAHLDHILGLTFLLDFVAVTPLKKVHVYGERAKIQAIQKHLFAEAIFPVLPPIEWHFLEDLGQEFWIGETHCRWFPLKHPGGSVGYRFEGKDLSLAYITDTTASPESSYWREIQGVEWLLHECNFSDQWIELAIKTGHSWTTGVLESATGAGIQRLILTHINPLAMDSDPLGLLDSDAKVAVYPLKELIVARDSLVLDISSL
jgi:ribonuclease BN (tRNA processing enzyme)